MIPASTRRYFTVFVILFGTTACSDLDSFMGNKKARNESAPLPKKLEQIAISLNSSEYRETCDDLYGPLRRDVTWALDQRADEIIDVSSALADTSKYETLDAGSMVINRLRKKETGEDKWKNSIDSWKDIEKIWNEIRNTPTDKRWVGMNSYVRSLLMDDRDRVLDGVNFYLTRADIPILPEVKAGVDSCEADPNCLNPKFSESAEALMKRNYYYNSFLEKLAIGTDNRTYIGRLKKWVDFDLKDTTFIKNAGITSKDGTTIVVPMNAGSLAGSEKLLSSIIESAWSTHGLKVEINWTDRSDVFKIVQTDDIGGRAFVRYRDSTMNISSGVRDTTIAHEFGHVLGLPDEYYTTWNRDTCEYNYEFNDANLMSTSSTGITTEDHVKSLKSNYGL